MPADQLERPSNMPEGEGNDYDLKNLRANRNQSSETDPEEARLRNLRSPGIPTPQNYNLQDLEPYRRLDSQLNDGENVSDPGFGQDLTQADEAPVRSQPFQDIRSTQGDTITDRALERAKERYANRASRGVPGADQSPSLQNGRTGEKLSSNSFKNITAKKGTPWNPPAASQVTNKGLEKAGQQVGKATAKAAASAGAKVAGKVGTKVAVGAAAGAATGGAATAIQLAYEAGSALFQKFNTAQNRKR
ncbi:MAG TPA: hypothetical protein VGE59_02395, partial [Patescibacteria group bacterium]